LYEEAVTPESAKDSVRYPLLQIARGTAARCTGWTVLQRLTFEVWIFGIPAIAATIGRVCEDALLLPPVSDLGSKTIPDVGCGN
jgi:hypothetical protein